MEKKLPIDLTNMSSKDLVDLQHRVAGALKDAMAREKVKAREAAEKAAAEFGFSLDEVFGKSESGRKRAEDKTVSPPKYRNPNDKSQTWTGRGRKPRWFIEAMAAGVPPEDLEI